MSNESLRYQWQRNDVDIPGAQSPTYSFTPTLDDTAAAYRIVVSNDLGDTPSSSATLGIAHGERVVPIDGR